jgi:16S rRNA (cytidine1402-2'-O)-methyltransferase
MLNLLSTPIGNLNDISLRAIDALKDADFIYAEDTRVTNKLLNFLKIEKKCRTLHEHNEELVSQEIIKLLNKNNKIILVSDAGTPSISDPGYYLVQQCIEQNISFSLIPGPSSVISALVMSGLSTSSFSFLGFVPRKKSQKKDFFNLLRHERNTVILFESAKRIEDTLQVIRDEYSSKNKIALCREMTKLHETIERGSIENVLQRLKDGRVVLKGEFVIVIESSSLDKPNFIIDKKIKESFLKFLPAKDAAKLISLLTKENKRDIYKQLLD